MQYTKEQLINLPIGRLIDIIEELQKDNEKVVLLRRKLAKISDIVNEPIITLSDSDKALEEAEKTQRTERRGRPRMTPEQKAASYEEYKRKKREAYAKMKAEKANKENNSYCQKEITKEQLLGTELLLTA